MRVMRARIAAIAGMFLALPLGCTGEDEKEVLPPVVLGMQETTPPAYDDGEEQLYQVSREVRLPYRRMEDAERPTGRLDPYPRPAFHVTTDTRVTVRFTLSNLEDKRHSVELLVDPWNEFVRYVPGATAGREEGEMIPNFSGIQRTFILEPRSRIEGIITPDDMVELATDLATAMSLQKTPPAADGDFGGAALYNRAFNIQNRSSEPDPVLAQYMPRGPKSTIPAIIGFDIGLRTHEPAKLAVELVVDIEDLNGERVVMDGEEGNRIGRPGQVLTPPAAAPRM